MRIDAPAAGQSAASDQTKQNSSDHRKDSREAGWRQRGYRRQDQTVVSAGDECDPDPHEEAAAKGPKEVTGGRGLKAHIALPHRRSECADD